MLGDKIKFGDSAAWNKARAALNEKSEYISDAHISCDEEGNAAGGYYEVVARTENTAAEKQARIAQNQAYLDETDWYVIRHTETGALIPEEITTRRNQAREEISALREEK